MLDNKAIFRFVMMLALSYAVLLAASVRLGPLYGNLWLPLFQWEMEHIAPDYRVVTLHIVERQQQRVVESVIETARPVRIGGTIIPADLPMTGSTIIGNQLLHPVLLFSFLLAWPKIRLGERFILLFLSLPFLVVVEVADIPLALLGGVQDVLLYTLAPDHLSGSFLVYWMNFLSAGGRQALTLSAAVLTLITYRYIHSKKHIFWGDRHAAPLPE